MGMCLSEQQAPYKPERTSVFVWGGYFKQTKGVLLDGTRNEWKCERAADNSV
jgi:hypothetical protein